MIVLAFIGLIGLGATILLSSHRSRTRTRYPQSERETVHLSEPGGSY